MDENEQNELREAMEQDSVAGHLGDTNKVLKRSGRGFKWDAVTGKYLAE